MKMSVMRVIAPLALCLLASAGVQAGKHSDGKVRTLVVKNTKDCGRGSLRWAIEKANRCDNPTRIEFELKKSDEGYNCETKQWTIKTESTIEFTGPDTTIDGYSQPGAKPNTNPAGEPDNSCVKIVVQSPPVVSEATAKAFVSYVKSLLAKEKGLPSDSAKLSEAGQAVIAKLLAQDKSISGSESILVPLRLPIIGSARVRGINLLGRLN